MAGRPILPPGRVSPSLLKAHNLIFASQTALPAAKRLRPARIKLNETGERASASDNERAEASGRASGSDNVLIAEKVDVACPAEAVSIKGASEQADVGDFGASSQSTDQASKPLVSFKVMAPLATERVGLADRIRKAAASIDDLPICDQGFWCFQFLVAGRVDWCEHFIIIIIILIIIIIIIIIMGLPLPLDLADKLADSWSSYSFACSGGVFAT